MRSLHLCRYLDLLQGLGRRGLELLEGGLRYFAAGLVRAVRLSDCRFSLGPAAILFLDHWQLHHRIKAFFKQGLRPFRRRCRDDVVPVILLRLCLRCDKVVLLRGIGLRGQLASWLDDTLDHDYRRLLKLRLRFLHWGSALLLLQMSKVLHLCRLLEIGV